LKFKTVKGGGISNLSLPSAFYQHVGDTELFQDRNAGKNNLISWHSFPLK